MTHSYPAVAMLGLPFVMFGVNHELSLALPDSDVAATLVMLNVAKTNQERTNANCMHQMTYTIFSRAASVRTAIRLPTITLVFFKK